MSFHHMCTVCQSASRITRPSGNLCALGQKLYPYSHSLMNMAKVVDAKTLCISPLKNRQIAGWQRISCRTDPTTTGMMCIYIYTYCVCSIHDSSWYCSSPARWGSLDLNKGVPHSDPLTQSLRPIASSDSSHAWTRTPYHERWRQLETHGPEHMP